MDTLSTQFQTEKSCKWGVNHNITKGTRAYSGSPYRMSRDQLYCVMTSSDSHAYSVVGICLLKIHHNLFIHDKPIFRYIISFRTFWSTHVSCNESCVSRGEQHHIRKSVKLCIILYRNTVIYTKISLKIRTSLGTPILLVIHFQPRYHKIWCFL